MTFTLLVLAYMLGCAALGIARPQRSATAGLAVSLAAVMVCAQFVLLLTQ